MKKNKLFTTGIAALSLFGAVSCGGTKSNPTEAAIINEQEKEAATIDETEGNGIRFDSYNRKGYLTGIEDDDFILDIFNSLISKGSDLIVGGIQTYSKTVIINLLKECGFDFRDATTKTLEKMTHQLNVIAAKIDALAEQEDQHYSQSVLCKVLEKIKRGQEYAEAYVAGGLGTLIDMENDPTKTEEEIEEKRKTYYKNTVSKLNFDGKPFASFVKEMAEDVLLPNLADLSSDIFTYYNKTLGVYNTWSTFTIDNTCKFMAQILETIVACTNLAKFQIYYLTLGKDEATIKTYETIITGMVTAVNTLNEKFKNYVSQVLQPMIDKRKQGINVYMSTNKEYSFRMATLTFNLDDKVDDDTRCALYMDYYTREDGGWGQNDSRVLEYTPDKSFIASVAKDYRTFANAFYDPNYTIRDYLKSAGFYANNQDLFDKSVGLYNANGYSDGHGLNYDDKDITATYYNLNGEYTRNLVYKVDAYHNWNLDVRDTVLHNCDSNYYLCFATMKDGKQVLDGTYEKLYIGDVKYTLNKALPYKKYAYDAITANRNHTWYLHDCW